MKTEEEKVLAFTEENSRSFEPPVTKKVGLRIDALMFFSAFEGDVGQLEKSEEKKNKGEDDFWQSPLAHLDWTKTPNAFSANFDLAQSFSVLEMVLERPSCLKNQSNCITLQMEKKEFEINQEGRRVGLVDKAHGKNRGQLDVSRVRFPVRATLKRKSLSSPTGHIFSNRGRYINAE